MVLFDLLDFFLDEFTSHNAVTSHFCYQKHNLLHFSADVILLLLEICVNFLKHFFLEYFCFTLIFMNCLNLLVFLGQTLFEGFEP
jgi:hypothetical protein